MKFTKVCERRVKFYAALEAILTHHKTYIKRACWRDDEFIEFRMINDIDSMSFVKHGCGVERIWLPGLIDILCNDWLIAREGDIK